jgi:hypothetical protein
LTITTEQLGDHDKLHCYVGEAVAAAVAVVRNMVVEVPTDVPMKRW